MQRPRVVELAQQLGERRQRVVALEHRAGVGKARAGAFVQGPHRIGHRRVVRIDAYVGQHRMAGDVEVRDRGRVEIRQIRLGIPAQVRGVDEEVVDVEQHAAAAAPAQLGEKLRLVHLVAGEGDVDGGILEVEAPAQALLHRVDSPRDVREHRLGVGERQQVV
jgi:hypothetical protein